MAFVSFSFTLGFSGVDVQVLRKGALAFALKDTLDVAPPTLKPPHIVKLSKRALARILHVKIFHNLSVAHDRVS